MTKNDHNEDRGTTDEPRSGPAHQREVADEAARAEGARVAGLQSGGKSPSGAAPVEPHAEHFPHQPHGQAGQPQNRPAREGHQGITPIQPEEQGLETGISPTEAVTHGEPSEVVETEYSRHKGHGEKPKAGHDKSEHKVVHVNADEDKKRDASRR